MIHIMTSKSKSLQRKVDYIALIMNNEMVMLQLVNTLILTLPVHWLRSITLLIMTDIMWIGISSKDL